MTSRTKRLLAFFESFPHEDVLAIIPLLIIVMRVAIPDEEISKDLMLMLESFARKAGLSMNMSDEEVTSRVTQYIEMHSLNQELLHALNMFIREEIIEDVDSSAAKSFSRFLGKDAATERQKVSPQRNIQAPLPTGSGVKLRGNRSPSKF